MKRRFPSLTILIALFALTASAAWAGNAKVQVCHIPPGNPGNFHTITISENALQAHLGHGDLAGACFAHCDTLCSDGNACTIDACDASERCVSTHPPVNCDDGSLCTIDSCNPATGCANVTKTCTDADNCTVNACDPLTGSCVAPPVVCPAGQACVPDTGSCEANLTCPCNDVPGIFHDFVAGTFSVVGFNCYTNFGGAGITIDTRSFSFGAVVLNDGRWLCGPTGDSNDFHFDLSPEEGQLCVELAAQAAASQGLTCGPIH